MRHRPATAIVPVEDVARAVVAAGVRLRGLGVDRARPRGSVRLDHRRGLRCRRLAPWAQHRRAPVGRGHAASLSRRVPPAVPGRAAADAAPAPQPSRCSPCSRRSRSSSASQSSISRPRAGDGPQFIGRVTGNGLFLVFTALTVSLPFFLPLIIGVVAGDSIAGEAGLGTLRYLLTVPGQPRPAACGEDPRRRDVHRDRRPRRRGRRADRPGPCCSACTR